MRMCAAIRSPLRNISTVLAVSRASTSARAKRWGTHNISNFRCYNLPRMQLFIDTAKVDEIRAAADWGILDGVTTNPTHIAATGRPFEVVLREIFSIVDGPISVETVSLDAEGIVAEGR